MCDAICVTVEMGSIFSKKSKQFDKKKLEEEIEIGYQPNNVITTHNNSVISGMQVHVPITHLFIYTIYSLFCI